MMRFTVENVMVASDGEHMKTVGMAIAVPRSGLWLGARSAPVLCLRHSRSRNRMLAEHMCHGRVIVVGRQAVVAANSRLREPYADEALGCNIIVAEELDPHAMSDNQIFSIGAAALRGVDVVPLGALDSRRRRLPAGRRIMGLVAEVITVGVIAPPVAPGAPMPEPAPPEPPVVQPLMPTPSSLGA